jgi:hypothetical protein
MMDQWTFWAAMLCGEKRDDLIQKGNPQSGFYRDGNRRAVAIWRDENNKLQWSVTAGYNPRHEDEIDELFGFVLGTPISREVYMAHAEGKGWPEDVPAAGRVVEKTDNNPPEELTPDKTLAAEIVALENQCRTWLQSLPNGKPSNRTEADLAANYAEKFLAFENRAIAEHKAEKAPHLEAGRLCDAKWFAPVRDKAAELKKKIKDISLAWARAEDARKAEEARIANEAARRAAEEANRKAREDAYLLGAAPPPEVKPVEVVVKKTKVGTGRAISARSQTTYIIDDWKAVAVFFAGVPDPAQDLKDVLQKLTNAAMKSGLVVPSVKTVKD